jgi:heme oxygenase
VLQDSVFLQECYPELFLWRHPLFTSTNYQNFKSELLDAVQVEVDPSVTRMEDVMPDMCAAVRHQTNTITMDMSIHGTRLSRIENQLNRIETNLYRYNNSIGYAFSSIGSQLNQAGSQFEVELGPVDSVFESLYSPENRAVIEPNRNKRIK